MGKLFKKRSGSRDNKSKKGSKVDIDPFASTSVRENPLYVPKTEAHDETPLLDLLMPQDRKQKHKLGERHEIKGGGGSKDGVSKSANDVERVRYKHNIGNSDTGEGFFKAAQNDTKSGEAHFARIGVDEDENEMKDAHLGARAVASSRLDSALGLGILSEDVFAKHKGHKGTTSAMVDGRESMTNHFDDKGKLADQTFLEHDYSSPSTQKGMWDLQAMDYLTGQVDRHQANIFVDQDSGKVTGIDNDLAFGTNNEAIEGDVGNAFGLPQMMDSSTARAISGMSEKEFLKTIGGKRGDYGKLNAKEKQAALERFQAMQAHIATLEDNDALVDEWNDDTFEQATAGLYEENGDMKKFGHFDREDNLLARSVRSVEEQKKRDKTAD